MRTYSGNRIDLKNAAANGFAATVTETAFDLDDAFLDAWRRDMRKYYPDYIEPLEVAEEPAVIESTEEISKPKYVPSPTFVEKMLRSAEVLQDRYDELKNYALRFKKLKSRISKKFDSINQGRLQFVKLSVAGKTLKLYLNMDINDIDPKYHCKDMRDKKTYVTVPVQLRIKSGRAVKYAKILIDKCAELHGLKENPKFVEVDAMALVEEFNARGEATDEAAATEV